MECADELSKSNVNDSRASSGRRLFSKSVEFVLLQSTFTRNEITIANGIDQRRGA